MLWIQGQRRQTEMNHHRRSQIGWISRQESCDDSLVRLVELHDLLLQFFGLVGGEAQLADVVACQFLWVVVSQLRLRRVGAQHGVGGKGAGKTT